jgi:hypothetical protein
MNLGVESRSLAKIVMPAVVTLKSTSGKMWRETPFLSAKFNAIFIGIILSIFYK